MNEALADVLYVNFHFIKLHSHGTPKVFFDTDGMAEAILSSDWLAERDRAIKEAVWDEACQALGWALNNGSPEDAVAHVVGNCPYRLARGNPNEGEQP